ncbi:MAG: MerR family transcriptional regulator [Clostridia bacterium]|nr:MerR family transcriptional regulator [Clostridia bacterium]
MMSVHEVSKLAGVSVRTLHHYDAIGLLPPAAVTDAGYRLYDEESLARLQDILLFRELEFPLKEIKSILGSPDFDRQEALTRQTALLTIRKERLEQLIAFAQALVQKGNDNLNFSAFDQTKLKQYEEQAKNTWGETDAYKEYEQKTAQTAEADRKQLARQMMQLMADFGSIKARSPADPTVQEKVQQLRDFITANYYTCTKPILSGLGQMYAVGGEMTENIDAAGGAGTGAFIAAAIREYCR